MITLSYILTTFNKIDYLKVALPDLISNCLSDEEIIIYDGGSTDGTFEYLSELKAAGKINQFVSEKDYGEAHGFNKAILNANGELIKIVTDDDCYNYQVVQCCKSHMLQNKEIDVIGFDGFGINLNNKFGFKETAFINDFKTWKAVKQPFLFCGLSLLLRKSSIPLLGLFHSKMKIVDWEYTLRITSLPIKMSWCNAFGFVNIANSSSNSSKMELIVCKERDELEAFYLNKRKRISHYNKYQLVKFLSKLKRGIMSSKNFSKDYIEVYTQSKTLLDNRSKDKTISFL